MKETNVPTSFADYKNQTHQKTPKSLCHQLKHSHCQEEKPMASEAFHRAVRAGTRLSICTPGSMQGLRNNPRPQQFQHTLPVLTPKLWGLQQLPWSPQHSLGKCDWRGFLLLIISSHRSENPFAWLCFRPEQTVAGRPEVALPEHFTETTAPIFHQAQHFCDSLPTGLETVFPVSPEGTPTQIFSSSWIHQKHTRRPSRTQGSAPTGQSRGGGMEVREPGYFQSRPDCQPKPQNTT